MLHDATPNIVGRNISRAFGHSVAMCCDMLDVVGSSLAILKLDPTTPNMLQQGRQTHATCCAQQCCDILRWHVAFGRDLKLKLHQMQPRSQGTRLHRTMVKSDKVPEWCLPAERSVLMVILKNLSAADQAKQRKSIV